MALNEEPATILIAGGGIVGLTLAMAIKKQLGIIPEIYEKTSTFATEAGAGLGMYPNGLRVIRDISPELLQAVRDAGYPYKTRRWERHDGTEIMTAEESVLSSGEAELDSIGIRRHALQEVLYKFALEQGITTNFKKPLLGAEEQSDGLIKVHFGDGSTRLTRILFGADGALGKSRSIVAGDDEPDIEYTGVTCLMGLAKIPCEGVRFPSSSKQHFHAVFFPTAKDEQCFQFHVPVSKEESNTLNWGNLSDEVGIMECKKIADQLRADGWHEDFIKPLENCFKAVRVGFALLKPRLKSWVRGRVALVGDAAHPPVPYVGQGAQQGLEDLGVAVTLLKIHCLDENGNFDPTNFEKAMKVYQEIRIPRSTYILDFSKSLGNMQASRAGDATLTRSSDDVLKGEVLMYGTLPVMRPGAQHDYKDDIKRATEEHKLPDVTAEAAMEAMDYLLGGISPESNARSKEGTAPSKMEAEKSSIDYSIPREHEEELIGWTLSTLQHLLQKIVAHRNVQENKDEPSKKSFRVDHYSRFQSGKVVVDEVCEVINWPKSSSNQELLEEDPTAIKLSKQVTDQLNSFVRKVASLYRNNPFHNFEHACNVTLNVYKLLSRMDTERVATSKTLNQALGAITDPLTEFAMIFAALIHDCDHEGVPNVQLAREHPMMAQFYHGQALAEQNSVDMAWIFFMCPKFNELRATICTSEEEMKRLRQLIVNIVIATDICDKELKAFRDARWFKHFESKESDEDVNRFATIGVEHLIQASDISHTMQPWEVYTKWNERLYKELFKAYKEGRAEKDPSEMWFKGEIGFFDFYIIPLATRLQQCEIFGSASDEFLSNAVHNREEWLRNGEEFVGHLIEETQAEWTVAA